MNFIAQLHKFVNQALKDIARSRFEHQIIDNLSGFLEEFSTQYDIEGFKNKGNKGVDNNLCAGVNRQDDKVNAHLVKTNDGEGSARDTEIDDRAVNPIVWYIIITSIVLFVIIVVALVVVYSIRKSEKEPVPRNLSEDIRSIDVNIGRKLYNTGKTLVEQRFKYNLII